MVQGGLCWYRPRLVHVAVAWKLRSGGGMGLALSWMRVYIDALVETVCGVARVDFSSVATEQRVYSRDRFRLNIFIKV